MKICKTCNIQKNKKEFWKSSRNKTGLSNSCIDCEKIKSNKWRKENTEKLKESWKKSRENKKQPIEIRRKKVIGATVEETNEKNRIAYQKNKEEISLRRKAKIRTREIKQKAILITKRYREKNKEKYNEYQRKFRTKNKIYNKATSKVAYALYTGKLIRPTNCEKCNEIKPLEGHHEDYSKPLEVMWLCKKCHCKQHNKLLDIS